MTDEKPRVYRGRCRAGKLNKPELVSVGRKLRDAAIEGDINAALALSNFALVEALSKQPQPQEQAA